MPKRILLTILCCFSLSLPAATVSALDPGIRDTLRIQADTLIAGRSIPLTVSVFNDEEIEGFDFGFLLDNSLGGWASYDSITFIGRMSDPTLLYFRPEPAGSRDGVPPDTVGIAAWGGPDLPTGDGPIAQVWVTGVDLGDFRIDSASYPPAPRNLLIPVAGDHFVPFFIGDTAVVIDGTALPVISAPDVVREVHSNQVQISISASSPDGVPVDLQFSEIRAADDQSVHPSSSPGFSGGNPASLVWTPDPGDVGIWEAVFSSCDTTGTCSYRTVEIQVVHSSNRIVDFAQAVESTTVSSIFMARADLDTDDNLEILHVGNGLYSNPISVFDYQGAGSLTETFILPNWGPAVKAPALSFVDGDPYPDMVIANLRQDQQYGVSVLLADGNGGFTGPDYSNTGAFARAGAMINYNGDQYLDYATVGSEIAVYAGGDPEYFSEVYRSAFSTSYSLNGADFNGDGYDDLAVGSDDGLAIYLNQSGSGFQHLTTYSQDFYILDIDITNEGTDFNLDGEFDLCVASPSTGGENSEIMLYIGNGDGTFQQSVVRTVLGHTVANRIGDINSDGNLDIVYVNGSRSYIGILFGDGDGAFTSEIRYPVPGDLPRRLVIVDYDLDGDLDIVVGSADLPETRSVVTLENQLDPSGFQSADFDIQVNNNAQLELRSPSGAVLNQYCNLMPTATLYRRNLDGDAAIDQTAGLRLAESGAYVLNVKPTSTAARGETFSVNYEVDGKLYRLAASTPMSPEGYNFTVYPNGSSPVAPIPGAFIYNAQPTFIWQGDGSFDFEIASDINFADILHSATVEDGSFTLPAPLDVADTTAFFWRIKPSGDADFGGIYAVNVMPASQTACGDVNGDGSVSVSDLTYFVDYLFRSGPAPANTSLADVNGSGSLNVSDLSYLVDYLFRGGQQPTCGA